VYKGIAKKPLTPQRRSSNEKDSVCGNGCTCKS
jgi:hypothetical protein